MKSHYIQIYIFHLRKYRYKESILVLQKYILCHLKIFFKCNITIFVFQFVFFYFIKDFLFYYMYMFFWKNLKRKRNIKISNSILNVIF